MPKPLKIHKLQNDKGRGGYSWWACKPDITVLGKIDNANFMWKNVTCQHCLKRQKKD